MLETVQLLATKLSRLDACKDKKIVYWCRMQASSQSLQDVIDHRVNEVGVSTVLGRSTALCC